MGWTTESQGLTRGIVIPISRGMSRTLKGEGGQRPYGPLGNVLTINEGPWHRQLRKTCPTLFYRPSLLVISKPWRTKKYIKWGGGRKKERRQVQGGRIKPAPKSINQQNTQDHSYHSPLLLIAKFWDEGNKAEVLVYIKKGLLIFDHILFFFFFLKPGKFRLSNEMWK